MNFPVNFGSGRAQSRLAVLFSLLLLQGTPASLAAPPGTTKARPAKAGVSAASQEQVSYYGVYLRDAKVGSFTLKRRSATRNGAPALRAESAMNLDMRVLGANTKVTSTSVSWTDKTGKPLTLNYRTEAAGRVTEVSATYTADSVSYRADIQGTIKAETLRLAPEETFLADASNGGLDIKPKPGMVMEGKVFSPELLRLIDSEVTVFAQEPVALGGQSVPGYKVVDKSSISTTTFWLADNGDLLRLDAVMGIQVRRELKEQALAAPKPGEKVDIATAVGITPTGVALAQPRSLRRAEYEITGLTKRLGTTTGNTQSTSYSSDSPGALRARVTVTAAPLPTGSTVPIFTPNQPVPDALQPYLKSTLYVPAGDARFKELARSVVGEEKDAARAAAKIAAWVHKTVTPDPGIATIRTAKDILDMPRGVCRDYTTLFTAIARAGGLPTKQCVGVAFADGRFLYHAWPEVWVGNDTWIALEPTWGAPFADATHIKLAEGEITDIYSVAQDLGNYQIKVLQAE